MPTKVALVTGANTGIGYATVKGLCEKFDGDVVLTAISEDAAEKAVKELAEAGFTAKGVQLDQTDAESIKGVREYMEKNYGRLDVLVCNAGVSYKLLAKQMDKEDETRVVHEAAKKVFDINYHGTISVMKELDGLLQKGSRIAVLSSRGAGFALRTISKELQDSILKPGLSIEEMTDVINRYLKDVENGDYDKKGWSGHVGYSYPLSKVGLAKLVISKQTEFDDAGRDIFINACCPGVVATPSTSFVGVPAEKGAEMPIYLSLIPAEVKEPKGKFLADGEVADLFDMAKGVGVGTLTNKFHKMDIKPQ